MEGLSAPARFSEVGLRVVVWFCVHVDVHLHLIVQNLHKLLHGGQVTRLQFWPNRYIYKREDFLSNSLNFVPSPHNKYNAITSQRCCICCTTTTTKTHHLMWLQMLPLTLTGFQSYCWRRTPSCRHISERRMKEMSSKLWTQNVSPYFLLWDSLQQTCMHTYCTVQLPCGGNRRLCSDSFACSKHAESVASSGCRPERNCRSDTDSHGVDWFTKHLKGGKG